MLWIDGRRSAGMVAALIAALALLAGCGGEDSAPAPVRANRVIDHSPGTLAIQGNYTDDYGGSHLILPTEWSVDYGGGPSITEVVSVDHAQRMLVGYLGTFVDAFGGTPLQDNHSRFDWVLHQAAADPEQSLYYCQSYPYVGSAAAAAALPRADDAAPDTGGCAGFTWSRLGPPSWPQFFHPEWALGAPGGTLDTVSLGYDPAAAAALGGSLTLGLGASGNPASRACIEDEPGDDFVVFENPFVHTDPLTGFTGTANEVAIVELAASAAGPWYAFPHSLDGGLELIQRARYTGFAGVTPLAEGGDRFDLQELIDEVLLPADWQACYLRLVDGGTLYADYGNTQSDLWATGADIDAVEALHAVEAPGLAP